MAAEGRRAPHGIDEWVTANGFAHVVWAALKPKFDGAFKTPSVAEVLRHLTRLAGTDRDRAEEYVRTGSGRLLASERLSLG